MTGRRSVQRGAALVLLAGASLLWSVSGASGEQVPPPAGMRFFADLGGKPGTYEVITVSTTRGTLRDLSFRAVRDTRVTITRRMEGRTVGSIALGDGAVRRLVLPRGAAERRGPITLARLPRPDGAPASAVVLRASGPVVLSVRDLPAGTTAVSITFDGAGRGILGPPHGCPVRPTLRLHAVRRGAAPVSLDSGVSC